MSEEGLAPESVEEAPIMEESGSEVEGSTEAPEMDLSAEDQSELQDAVEDAIDEGASEEEIKSMIKSFALKVNGKEVIKEIDLNDEEAIKRELQLAHAGRGAMQRSKELEKTYSDALSELKDNPFKVLQELGLDVDDLNKSYLEKQIEQMKKSPEELAQEKYESELAEAREAEKKYKEELDKIKYDKVLAEEEQKLGKEIDDALDAYTDLPDNPKVRQKIAETMMWAMEQGHNDVSPKDVLPTVARELEREQQDFFNSMPVDYFEKFIGKQNMEKMREKRLAKAKEAPKSAKVTETAKKIEDESEKKKKKVSSRDFFRNLGR